MDIHDHPDYIIHRNGEVWSKPRTYYNLLNAPPKAGQILKPRDSKGGYNRVILYTNGKAKAESVHRLVANAFLPNPNNYTVVNHKDGNPKNNDVSNLEWCTGMYNGQSFNKPNQRTGTIVVYHGKRKTSYIGKVKIYGKLYTTKSVPTAEEAELELSNIVTTMKLLNI